MRFLSDLSVTRALNTL